MNKKKESTAKLKGNYDMFNFLENSIVRNIYSVSTSLYIYFHMETQPPFSTEKVNKYQLITASDLCIYTRRASLAASASKAAVNLPSVN